MTAKDIIYLFQQKRLYEAELSIMRDCSDEIQCTDQNEFALHYALLKRKLALLSHWLDYLSPDEKEVVELHLIQGNSWARIATFISESKQHDIPCDERTLQRIQTRAIASIEQLMDDSFKHQLDFLLSYHDQ